MTKTDEDNVDPNQRSANGAEVGDNLLAFERRPSELPLCELVLRPDDCSIFMSVYNRDGDVEATLTFALVGAKPADFDIDRLRKAWSRWKDASTYAA